MAVYYHPRKLLLAKEKVEATLEHTGRFKEEDEEEDSLFRQFLTSLVKLPSNQVKKFAEKADHETITKLADYVSSNKYKLKYDNMFLALWETGNKDDWAILVEDWENHPKQKEVQKFIGQLYHGNEEFKDYLDNQQIKYENFNWIESEEPVLEVGKYCTHLDTEAAYGSDLVENGIVSETILYHECLLRFALVCSANAYLSMGDEKVGSIYNQYNGKGQIELLCNFLGKISKEKNCFSILDKYEYTYEKVKSSFKIIGKTIEAVLTERDLWNVYINWRDRMEISLAFDGDPYRRDFWLKYQYGNIIDYSHHEILYIIVGQYVITEFKGKAAGPCYLMDRDYFEKRVKGKIKSFAYSKQEIQSFLHNEYETKSEGMYVKLLHLPGEGMWCGNFSRTLRRYGIRPSFKG